MADQQESNGNAPDPEYMSRTMSRIAERSQRLISEFMNKQNAGGSFGMADPLNVGQAFFELTQRMMTNPAQFALRRVIEKYTKNARFCIICNYASKIIPARRLGCFVVILVCLRTARESSWSWTACQVVRSMIAV